MQLDFLVSISQESFLCKSQFAFSTNATKCWISGLSAKMKVKLSWVHMISYDCVIQVQTPARLGQLVGKSKTILMNLGWLFSFKKSPDQGNFYLVSSFIGTAGWNFSNKTNHGHLAFLQTFIFFNTKKIIFLTSLLSLEKIQKNSSRSKGEKIKTFSVAYKIHLLFTSRQFLVLFGQPQPVFWLVTSDCCVL